MLDSFLFTVQRYLSDKAKIKNGTHGLDPLWDSMASIFWAYGPSFKKGFFKDEFISHVDAYQLMCYLLELTPAPHNGTWEHVKDLLKERPEVTTPSGANAVLIPSWILGWY